MPKYPKIMFCFYGDICCKYTEANSYGCVRVMCGWAGRQGKVDGLVSGCYGDGIDTRTYE